MLTLDFAGEILQLDGTTPFVIGREGDLRIEDNPYLHRRFLEIRREHDLWWLVNVGTQASITVHDRVVGVHAWLGSGARMPLVFGAMIVRFTAGSDDLRDQLDDGRAAVPVRTDGAARGWHDDDWSD